MQQSKKLFYVLTSITIEDRRLDNNTLEPWCNRKCWLSNITLLLDIKKKPAKYKTIIVKKESQVKKELQVKKEFQVKKELGVKQELESANSLFSNYLSNYKDLDYNSKFSSLEILAKPVSKVEEELE